MKIIGIAGGSGSGKTTLVEKIAEACAGQSTGIISLDYYYKDNSHIPLVEREDLNFDHPDAIEFELLKEHIDLLTKGEAVKVPQYSYITCTRLSRVIDLKAPEVLIIEGILTFHDKTLRDLFDLKVYIDLPEQQRFERIVERDMEERGRDKAAVEQRFYDVVNKMHHEFVEPGKQFADYVFDATHLRVNAAEFSNTIINDPKLKPSKPADS